MARRITFETLDDFADYLDNARELILKSKAFQNKELGEEASAHLKDFIKVIEEGSWIMDDVADKFEILSDDQKALLAKNCQGNLPGKFDDAIFGAMTKLYRWLLLLKGKIAYARLRAKTSDDMSPVCKAHVIAKSNELDTRLSILEAFLQEKLGL